MKLSIPRLALLAILSALLVGAVGSAWAAPRLDGTITEGEYWTMLNESVLATANLRELPAEESRAESWQAPRG